MDIVQIIMFIAGFVVGAGWFGVLYFRLKHKTGAYERKLEKTAVQNSSSTSRAEVLEAKIKVLEKALDDALNNQR